MQPLWRFTDSPTDGRLLVYRSEDVKNLSRIASPKVCGYVNAEPKDLLPQNTRGDWEGQERVDQEEGELCFLTLLKWRISQICADICAVTAWALCWCGL